MSCTISYIKCIQSFSFPLWYNMRTSCASSWWLREFVTVPLHHTFPTLILIWSLGYVYTGLNAILILKFSPRWRICYLKSLHPASNVGNWSLQFPRCQCHLLLPIFPMDIINVTTILYITKDLSCWIVPPFTVLRPSCDPEESLIAAVSRNWLLLQIRCAADRRVGCSSRPVRLCPLIRSKMTYAKVRIASVL